MSKKVFLGGTWNNSTWRDEIIKLFSKENIKYFNPIVKNWDNNAQIKEIYERENCDFCLYVITPKMTGIYSIAEAVDDSNKRPEKTIFVAIQKDEKHQFTESQWKSLKAVEKLIANNGGKVFQNFKQIINYIKSLK